MTETREGTDVVERSMRLLTDDVSIKIWCCVSAIETNLFKGVAMDTESLRTLASGFEAAHAEITRLRAENERLLASMRIVRNDLAALVPVPSADEPQWPEFFSAADYQCLTLALREARAAVELSKEPSNG